MPNVSLRMNPLVEKRVQVSAKQATVPLSGYLGPALQAEYVRLYQDLSLASFIELRREDIVDVVEGVSNRDPAQIFVKWGAQGEVHYVGMVVIPWFQPKPDPPLFLELLGGFMRPQPDPWYFERNRDIEGVR